MLDASSPSAAPSPSPSSLADINDMFRKSIGGHPAAPGRYVMTRGLALKGAAFVGEVLDRVRTYAAFTEANDPEGDHSFGDLTHNDVRIFWKIDCFEDADCEFGAEDPLRQCYRVLTVMLAEDW